MSRPSETVSESALATGYNHKCGIERNDRNYGRVERAGVSFQNRIYAACAGGHSAGGDGRFLLAAARGGGNRRDSAGETGSRPGEHNRIYGARMRTRLWAVVYAVAQRFPAALGDAGGAPAWSRWCGGSRLVSFPHP